MILEPAVGTSNALIKGAKGGACNRTACGIPGASWKHKDNGFYYCQKCAFQIMMYPENRGLLEKDPEVKDVQ